MRAGEKRMEGEWMDGEVKVWIGRLRVERMEVGVALRKRDKCRRLTRSLMRWNGGKEE